MAGRLFLEQIETWVSERRDFAFETTLSGKGYLKLIERMQAQGWTVELYYLALPDPEMSIQRVRERVRHEGHYTASADIKRRYPRSLRNLLIDYSMKVDECRCYMNADYPLTRILERFGDNLIVQDVALYGSLRRFAGLELCRYYLTRT